MAWVVAYAAGGAELQLRDWLNDKGAKAYVPQRIEERYLRHVKKPIKTTVPAFKGYVFIDASFGDIWGELIRAKDRGLLSYVIKMDGNPVEVPTRTVEDIMLAEAQGLLRDLRSESYLGFTVGTEVEITFGPLEGSRGKVIRETKSRSRRAIVEVGGRALNFFVSNLAICPQSSAPDARGDPDNASKK